MCHPTDMHVPPHRHACATLQTCMCHLTDMHVPPQPFPSPYPVTHTHPRPFINIRTYTCTHMQPPPTRRRIPTCAHTCTICLHLHLLMAHRHPLTCKCVYMHAHMHPHTPIDTHTHPCTYPPLLTHAHQECKLQGRQAQWPLIRKGHRPQKHGRCTYHEVGKPTRSAVKASASWLGLVMWEITQPAHAYIHVGVHTRVHTCGRSRSLHTRTYMWEYIHAYIHVGDHAACTRVHTWPQGMAGQIWRIGRPRGAACVCVCVCVCARVRAQRWNLGHAASKGGLAYVCVQQRGAQQAKGDSSRPHAHTRTHTWNRAGCRWQLVCSQQSGMRRVALCLMACKGGSGLKVLNHFNAPYMLAIRHKIWQIYCVHKSP